MGDPDFILSLKAVSKEAKSAFRDPHNANRLVSPESSDVQNDVYSSGRETTPFNLTEDDDPRLRLTFSQRPNHMGRGFTFSNDAKRCDVYIGKEDARRNRFSVAFDHQQRITLTDYSRSGIYVTYNGQGTRRPRRDFTWILFPEFQPIVLKIMRRDGQHFEVQVELPTHDSDSAEYQANISSFVKEGEEANPPLSLLTLHSRETVEAPIVTLFPRHRPQYYRICAIGGGEYGTVNKAIDVTSGKLVASKIFHKGNWKREVEIMKEMEHVSTVFPRVRVSSDKVLGSYHRVL